MINDCHVHLGKQSMINQWLTVPEYIQFREKFPYMSKTLFLGTDLFPDNGLINEVCHKYDWAYGLHWWIKDKNEVKLDNKMIGIKYHGAYMKRPVTSLNHDILESLENKILLVHCGRYLEGDIRSNTSYLHALKVAHHYPKIKVILAHMGGTDTTVCMKAIEHGSKYYNVYFDTSGITTPYIIEYAVEHLALHKIIFGSDMPWCSFNAMLWTVSDANILQTEKQAIFEDNFDGLIS